MIVIRIRGAKRLNYGEDSYMANIINIKAREVMDSRGNPTIEADVTLEGGFFGKA